LVVAVIFSSRNDDLPAASSITPLVYVILICIIFFLELDNLSQDFGQDQMNSNIYDLFVHAAASSAGFLPTTPTLPKSLKCLVWESGSFSSNSTRIGSFELKICRFSFFF
jgi:hypothetical protein